MFHKIKQFYLCLFPTIKSEDIKFAKMNLSKEEFILFNNMSDYDKLHSIRTAKDISSSIYSNDILVKLALLHDIGKPKNTKIKDRILHSLFKKNKNLIEHEKNGYEKLVTINYDIALLVLEHHNSSTNNEFLKIFQIFDNKN